MGSALALWLRSSCCVVVACREIELQSKSEYNLKTRFLAALDSVEGVPVGASFSKEGV